MKRLALALVATTTLLGACEKQASQLDTSTSGAKAAPGVGGGGPLDERVARLEATVAKYSESLEFLQKVYNQNKAQMEAQEANEADPNAIFAVDIANAVSAGQTEGPASATVTIIKAFDFACPYCERLTTPLHELVKEYDGKVRVVYMNLVVHPDTAQSAHLYSCAAAKQGKYVQFKDAFWEKGFKPYVASQGKERASMGEENILKIAGELGLDTNKLKADANGDACKKRVEEDIEELQKFRVQGTPGIFINGKFFGGAIPKQQFKAVIDERLKVAEASGVSGADYYNKEIMGKGAKEFRSKKDSKTAQ